MKLDGAELVGAVEQSIQKVRTRSLDISFNELVDMRDNSELEITPDYQRLFRWSPAKQSRFIESLILELPTPPIFVIEEEDGKYELIDGLQRISSYLHFRGKLPAIADSDLQESTPSDGDSLTLEDCDIVDALNGHTYETLPAALQIKLRRNFVRMEIIRKESDARLRYYMFKRLNTGGEILSEQEVRNCTIRLLDKTFNAFLIEMSGNQNFKQCIDNVSEDKLSQKYDQELVLRFFAFKNYRFMYKHEVGDFLTEYMEAVSDPLRHEVKFDYPKERATFEKTFRALNASLGSRAFARSKGGSEELAENFLAYHYEAFSLGLQPVLDRIDTEDPQSLGKLKKSLLAVKTDESFRQLTTGGGKNYRKPLDERIQFVSKQLEADL